MNNYFNIEKNLKKKYSELQTKLNFLPKSPLKSLKMQKLINMRLDGIVKSFNDPQIENALKFHLDNREELQSHKDGIVLGNYLQFIKQTEHLPGDILELGTYKGVSTIIFAKFLDSINSKKKIFTCDAFFGLPTNDKFSKSKNVKGLFNDTSINFVKSQFKKFHVENRIEIVNGLFEETLYQNLSQKKFSFTLVDCDIYDSTKFCLPFVYKQTTGIVAFDDYEKDKQIEARWGETKAVDEFCKENNLEILLNPIPHLKMY